ncbi:hypothetical protein H4582DRAFT_1850840 [Lactarius indigo]|nr:hypothetical protein H4582DRAFT_1850840 [Lactarius indigo]
MRISSYISISVAALFTLFPPTSVAQSAVQLNSQLPLEVRSPYFNFWTRSYSPSGILNSTDFFFTQALPGRTALIRIDGVTHSIWGQLPLANQTNLTGTFITATRTSFTFQIGPVELIATFFSPIEPGDWVRQSIPFTYLHFDIEATDGKAHDVQLYVHVQSGEFFNGADQTQSITWSTSSTGLSVYEMAQSQSQQVFSENSQGQPTWGQFYFATAVNDDVTYNVGPLDTLVGNFSAQGSLGPVPGTTSPVEGTTNVSTAFALSRNLGSVSNASAVFAIGFIQDPAVQYVDPTGISQRRHPYFRTKYPNTADLIDAFIGDFEDAWTRMLELESKIVVDSAGLPGDYYSTVLSYVTRLVFSSTVLTVGEAPDGTLDPTDVMMFMKNTGTVASTNRVNPVEVLYAAFPMFMYFDPGLGGPLLEPLLRYQSSESYTLRLAAPDAGSSYPNTTFSSFAHQQGIEQTANMLIMMYAYARSSGNGTSIQTYYPLLTNWTNYLVDTTLYTSNQESADLLSVNNQTNLAIKGIIAIKAMSLMAAAMSKSTDYSATANAYYTTWKSLALGSDRHVLAQYQNESSWSLAYNMFADHWLRTNLISTAVLYDHSNFLKRVNITAAPLTFSIADIGIPLDSLRPNNVTYSSNMFAAGFGDKTLQRLIFSGVETHPFENDVSITANATLTLWSASPDLGSAYAPLVLTVPLKSISTNGGSSALASHNSSAARKLGLALGCSLFVALIIIFAVLVYRRRMRLSAARFYATRRGHKRHRSMAPVESESGGGGGMMKLDFIPSFGASSKSVRARREPGWKNLEDYEYD